MKLNYDKAVAECLKGADLESVAAKRNLGFSTLEFLVSRARNELGPRLSRVAHSVPVYVRLTDGSAYRCTYSPCRHYLDGTFAEAIVSAKRVLAVPSDAKLQLVDGTSKYLGRRIAQLLSK